MAIPTRAEVEAELLSRAGALMLTADLDGHEKDGSNEDLAGPIAFSLRQLGITPAKFRDVTTADISAVSEADVDQLLDVAEWRLWKNIQGHLDDADLTIGDRSERYSQLQPVVQARITESERLIKRLYQIGEGKLSAGVLRVAFQETHPET